MKHALIIGASGGIGHALSNELSTNHYDVTRLSRQKDCLDVTRESVVAEKLEHLEKQFDLIIVSTGVLSGSNGPEKSLKAFSLEEAARLFAVNAVGPALILKHSIRLLPRDRRATFVVLSARVGSIGDNVLGGWYSYRASKAALNQLIRTASIELKRTHKHLVCAALHPGTVATEFTQGYVNHVTSSPEDAAKDLLNVIDKFSPCDTGRFFDCKGNEIIW
jgi:NAD(P)-dependent dehydrogenase (short-subunit alcohol dehydrogenase family)